MTQSDLDHDPAPGPTQRSRLRLIGVLATSSLLGACIMVPVGRRGGREGDFDDGDIVTVAPPSPQAEVAVAAPGPGYFWINGYWGWIGARYVWIGGHWQAHRAGWAWVPFGWTRHRHGWRAAPGHWDRR